MALIEAKLHLSLAHLERGFFRAGHSNLNSLMSNL